MTTRTDHAEIATLVDRFSKALDDRESTADRWRGLFTDDVRMETPSGTSQGADAVRATGEALERYERTSHIAGGVLADADADTGAVEATVSWNALMAHVHRAATLQERGGDADLCSPWSVASRPPSAPPPMAGASAASWSGRSGRGGGRPSAPTSSRGPSGVEWQGERQKSPGRRRPGLFWVFGGVLYAVRRCLMRFG
ncbi:nuclear transport factor 2 family protein [Streptomyces sennicomposti]